MVCITFCKSQVPVITAWPWWSFVFNFPLEECNQQCCPSIFFLASVPQFVSCWTHCLSSVLEEVNIEYFSPRVTSQASASVRILNERKVLLVWAQRHRGAALILGLGVYFCLVFLNWILAQCLLINRTNNTHCQPQNAFITSTSYKASPSALFLDKPCDPSYLKSLAKKKPGYPWWEAVGNPMSPPQYSSP